MNWGKKQFSLHRAALISAAKKKFLINQSIVPAALLFLKTPNVRPVAVQASAARRLSLSSREAGPEYCMHAIAMRDILGLLAETGRLA